MLAFKLKRIGKKHQPAYRLIVQEKREKLNGNYTEDLGWYNPLLKKHQFNKERIGHWLKVGVQATDTVHNLFVKEGIITGSKRPKHARAKADSSGAKAAEGTEVKPAAQSSENKNPA